MVTSDDDGNFTSPGYPDVYPYNRKCVTHIRAEVVSTIVIEFTTFDLEESENCSYDSLTMVQGKDGSICFVTLC